MHDLDSGLLEAATAVVAAARLLCFYVTEEREGALWDRAQALVSGGWHVCALTHALLLVPNTSAVVLAGAVPRHCGPAASAAISAPILARFAGHSMLAVAAAVAGPHLMCAGRIQP